MENNLTNNQDVHDLNNETQPADKKTYTKPLITSVQPLETRAGSSGGGPGGGS
jgi:hypothetical protein